MIDPLTAFAAVKGAISAGKELHSMTKELAGFFDACDGAKKAHDKKKNSIFASSNEEAMDTWMKKQQAIDAEAQLREIIVNTRGYSAYQDLLKIRRDIAAERKEQERQQRIAAQEFRQNVETAAVGTLIFVAIVGLLLSILYFKGYL
jgi:hypothetical protein